MKVLVLKFPTKDLSEDLYSDKIARRKTAKQSVQDSILSRWESWQAQRWLLPSDYRGHFLLSEWSLGSWTGWSLMEAASNHLEDSSIGWQGEFLTPQNLY